MYKKIAAFLLAVSFLHGSNSQESNQDITYSCDVENMHAMGFAGPFIETAGGKDYTFYRRRNNGDKVYVDETPNGSGRCTPNRPEHQQQFMQDGTVQDYLKAQRDECEQSDNGSNLSCVRSVPSQKNQIAVSSKDLENLKTSFKETTRNYMETIHQIEVNLLGKLKFIDKKITKIDAKVETLIYDMRAGNEDLDSIKQGLLDYKITAAGESSKQGGVMHEDIQASKKSKN